MIRYLLQEEKIRSRELWKEAFPEDSVSFVDYYYKDKILNNKILVEEEMKQIQSMVQRNPYNITVRESNWKVDYIVGVATRTEERHKGRMRRLLLHMFSDMYTEKMPFCFLMPAAKEIYLPFQFTYIFDQPKWKRSRNEEVEEQMLALDDEQTVKIVSEWMSHWLSAHAEVYTVRDAAYVREYLKELSSESGTCRLLKYHNETAGLDCRWGLTVPEQRTLMCDRKILQQTYQTSPAIMARIIHLESFMKVIRLKSSETEVLKQRIIIEDPLIEQNNGSFLWSLDQHGSTIQKEQSVGAENLHITIQDLTAWLFGYRKPEKLPDWCSRIQTLSGVYLDEVV